MEEQGKKGLGRRIGAKLANAGRSIKEDYQAGGVKKMARNKYFIILCGLFLLFMIVGNLAEPPAKEPKASSTAAVQGQSAAPVSPAAKKVGEEFADIPYSYLKDAMRNRTGLQREEFVKSVTGKRIQWVGFVYDTDEAWTGGYKVSIYMGYGKDATNDFSFKVSKEQALALKKYQKIKFTATIADVSITLGQLVLKLEDAQIVDTNVSR